MLLQSSKVQWGQNFSNNIKSLDHKTTKRDFPGGAVVKNPPANAGRGHGFEPWSGKIPQAAEQLSPCATTTEPVSHNDWSLHTLEPAYHNYWAHVLQLLKPACLKTVLCNKRSHRNEKPAHRKEEWPPLTTTRENPTRSNEDPTQPQNKTKQTNKNYQERSLLSGPWKLQWRHLPSCHPPTTEREKIREIRLPSQI